MDMLFSGENESICRAKMNQGRPVETLFSIIPTNVVSNHSGEYGKWLRTTGRKRASIVSLQGSQMSNSRIWK